MKRIAKSTRAQASKLGLAIATLALAVVLQTFIVNWSFVGGSRGAYVIPPNEIPFFGLTSNICLFLCWYWSSFR